MSKVTLEGVMAEVDRIIKNTQVALMREKRDKISSQIAQSQGLSETVPLAWRFLEISEMIFTCREEPVRTWQG